MAIFEVLNNQQSYFNRYFRRNVGDDDYATIPEVTLAGDFVFSVDILRSGTNTGGQFIFTARNSASGSYGLNLYSSGDWANGTGSISVFGFSGFPAISSLSTDKLYSIKVAYTASTGVLEMYSNNVLEFTGISSPNDGLATSDTMAIFGAPQGGFRLYGIVANLKIWDNGTLVRDYTINDNSNTIRDLANGQDGTIINGNAADWGLFDRQVSGDWKGNGLAVPPWDSVDQVLVTA